LNYLEKSVAIAFMNQDIEDKAEYDGQKIKAMFGK
jgi:hypothetical protein